MCSAGQELDPKHLHLIESGTSIDRPQIITLFRLFAACDVTAYKNVLNLFFQRCQKLIKFDGTF